MYTLKALILQSISLETIGWATAGVGCFFWLMSRLAYDAHKGEFLVREGRSMQMPGILKRYSPYHAVSSDLFRSRSATPSTALVLTWYRMSVVLFYLTIILDIAYLLLKYLPALQ